MPATSFVQTTVYDFTITPSAAPVRAPAPRARKPRRKPKRAPSRGGILTPQVVSLLDDRLEEAIEAGTIELVDDDGPFQGFAFTLAELAELKRMLLREAYIEPKRKPLATRTAPGTAERIEAYQQRVSAGEVLYSDADATAHRAHDRGLRVTPRLNGSGLKVLGWAEEK